MDQPQTSQGDQWDYDISISDILKKAWDSTNGTKGTIWIAFAVTMILSGVITVIFKFSAGSTGLAALLEGLVKLFITLPLGAGLAMIGIKLASDVPVEWSEVLNYFGRVVPLVGATLLMYLLVFIGICLLVLPGIYLAFAYSLTVPLMVERGLTVGSDGNVQKGCHPTLVCPVWFISGYRSDHSGFDDSAWAGPDLDGADGYIGQWDRLSDHFWL